MTSLAERRAKLRNRILQDGASRLEYLCSGEPLSHKTLDSAIPVPSYHISSFNSDKLSSTATTVDDATKDDGDSTQNLIRIQLNAIHFVSFKKWFSQIHAILFAIIIAIFTNLIDQNHTSIVSIYTMSPWCGEFLHLFSSNSFFFFILIQFLLECILTIWEIFRYRLPYQKDDQSFPLPQTLPRFLKFFTSADYVFRSINVIVSFFSHICLAVFVFCLGFGNP